MACLDKKTAPAIKHEAVINLNLKLKYEKT